MREIKFRGKRIDNGEWIYGYYHKAVSDGYARHYILPEVMWAHNHEFEVIPETVGQYIGLDNKNKVEIYEGDVIKDKDDNKGKVDFELGCFWLNGVMEYRDAEERNERSYRVEVIGNIHDNPELIK